MGSSVAFLSWGSGRAVDFGSTAPVASRGRAQKLRSILPQRSVTIQRHVEYSATGRILFFGI